MGDVSRLIDGDPNKFDPGSTQSLADLHEARDFLAARLAPSRPEIEHQYLALPLKEIAPLSGEVGDLRLMQDGYLVWVAREPRGDNRP